IENWSGVTQLSASWVGRGYSRLVIMNEDPNALTFEPRQNAFGYAHRGAGETDRRDQVFYSAGPCVRDHGKKIGRSFGQANRRIVAGLQYSDRPISPCTG